MYNQSELLLFSLFFFFYVDVLVSAVNYNAAIEFSQICTLNEIAFCQVALGRKKKPIQSFNLNVSNMAMNNCVNERLILMRVQSKTISLQIIRWWWYSLVFAPFWSHASYLLWILSNARMQFTMLKSIIGSHGQNLQF